MPEELEDKIDNYVFCKKCETNPCVCKDKIPKLEEILKEFDKRFGFAMFTWSGDNLGGKKGAKRTKRQVKKLIKSTYLLATKNTLKKVDKIIFEHTFECAKVGTSVNKLREKISQLNQLNK